MLLGNIELNTFAECRCIREIVHHIFHPFGGAHLNHSGVGLTLHEEYLVHIPVLANQIEQLVTIPGWRLQAIDNHHTGLAVITAAAIAHPVATAVLDHCPTAPIARTITHICHNPTTHAILLRVVCVHIHNLVHTATALLHVCHVPLLHSCYVPLLMHVIHHVPVPKVVSPSVVGRVENDRTFTLWLRAVREVPAALIVLSLPKTLFVICKTGGRTGQSGSKLMLYVHIY